MWKSTHSKRKKTTTKKIPIKNEEETIQNLNILQDNLNERKLQKTNFTVKMPFEARDDSDVFFFLGSRHILCVCDGTKRKTLFETGAQCDELLSIVHFYSVLCVLYIYLHIIILSVSSALCFLLPKYIYRAQFFHPNITSVAFVLNGCTINFRVISHHFSSNTVFIRPFRTTSSLKYYLYIVDLFDYGVWAFEIHSLNGMWKLFFCCNSNQNFLDFFFLQISRFSV